MESAQTRKDTKVYQINFDWDWSWPLVEEWLWQDTDIRNSIAKYDNGEYFTDSDNGLIFTNQNAASKLEDYLSEINHHWSIHTRDLSDLGLYYLSNNEYQKGLFTRYELN